MIYIIGVLLVLLMFLLAHLFFVKNQIKSIRVQLADINKKAMDKKVTMELGDREMEALCREVNQTIDARKQCEAAKVRLQSDLKQTIANMSHDLRTPLTSIIGYIQFMRLPGISVDEKNEYLNIAEQRAKTLEILLNDFYELSLVDSPDFEISMEKVNINRVLKEVLVGKYTEFKSRGLEPKADIPEEPVFIIAEHKSLERVIENLLSNAVKYADDNVSVYLAAREDTALLRISNTAEGLSSEDVEKIFDRFYMADKTRSGNGTGLGLSIAKELVEKMDGTIKAEKNNGILNIYCTFHIINV